MKDAMVLWAAQIGAAVVVGLATMLALKWCARTFYSPAAMEVRDKARDWPGALSRLAMFAPWVMKTGQVFARSSPAVGRDLLLAGAPVPFDERQFLLMSMSLALALAMLSGLLLATIWILDVPLPSGLWLGMPFAAIVLGAVLPRLKLHEIAQRNRHQVQRAFPSFLDAFALTLESGQNFQSALQLSVQRLPKQSAGLQGQLHEVLRDIRAGQTKVAALQRLQERLRLAEITQFVASVTAAERQGVSVTNLLRRQAEQLRTSRALAAERHAMKLPVKLLAPLAICIFPCTFLILAFPIGVRLSGSGLF